MEDCKCYCPDIDQWTKNASTAKAKLEAIDSSVWADDTYTTVELLRIESLIQSAHEV